MYIKQTNEGRLLGGSDFFLSSLEDMFIDFKVQKRDTDWLAPIHALPRDQTHHLAMCYDWEWNS